LEEEPKIEEPMCETIKKDASTSCNDLFKLDSPLCDQVCFKNIIVETCSQDITIENQQLKPEMTRLTNDLIQVKGKASKAQPHQDKTIKEVKKLDEGATMDCYMCHKEGHKSYECKVKNGGEKKKEKIKDKQASSPTPTPTRLTRRPLHHTC
jgi:hypothetical protein